MTGHALGDFLIPPVFPQSTWKVHNEPLECCGYGMKRRVEWSFLAAAWKNVHINTVKVEKIPADFIHTGHYATNK